MSKEGIVKLTDGSVLKLKITTVDAREAGFSPYGGINILVRPVGGVAVKEIPEALKEKVKDKPIVLGPELPKDGWEIIDIDSSEPAVDELEINTSKGPFQVKVVAEPVMAARNLNYKVAPELNEPLYNLSWVFKISWKPIKKGEG